MSKKEFASKVILISQLLYQITMVYQVKGDHLFIATTSHKISS